AGILFGGAVGLVNGLIVTRLRVNSLIATIGTMMILQGSVFLYSREAVQNHHHIASFVDIGAGYVGTFPIPVIITADVFVASSPPPRLTPLGRYLYAGAANPRAARLSGLRTDRLKLFAFVVTGLLVGVAGLILVSLMNAGQPTAGRGFELTVIASVILGGTSLSGGRGTLVGTLLGVLVLKVIDNGIILVQWGQGLQIIVPVVVLVLAASRDRVRRRADAGCRGTRHTGSREACAGDDRDQQALPRGGGAGKRRSPSRARQGARAHGRERRRQIDADQDPCRR